MSTEAGHLTESTIAPVTLFDRSIGRLKIPMLLVVLALGVGYVLHFAGQRQALLLVLGIALGGVLYWATFSFSNGWRRMITERNSLWLRAQMVMLVLASVLILPVLANGSVWGTPVFALVRPVGISLITGAFLFGIGMQIAGGCASGTLYHAGGGQLKMILVFTTFALGALLASAHYGWWMSQASLAPLAWTSHVGVVGALLVNGAIAGAIYWLVSVLEKSRHGRVEPLFARRSQNQGPQDQGSRRIGSNLLLGGVALAGLNFLTVVVAGRPWSVSNAFPVWGAKGSEWLGLSLDLEFWDYWSQPAAERALAGGLLNDITSVMNIGIILGALAAALLVKGYALVWRVGIRELVGGLLGGLLLGYGATIGFGCNIGAFLGGVVSGSLHGWVWFLFAFMGTGLGMLLRPWFALPVEGRGR